MYGSAKLTRGSGDFDLRSLSALDQGPQYTDIRADLRLWRFGLRGSYYYFDNKSVHHRLAKLQWSGARLGLDLDAVQHEWLTFGASVDCYLVNPSFNGNFFTTTTTITQLSGRHQRAASRLDNLNRIDLTGGEALDLGTLFQIYAARYPRHACSF